MAHSGSRSTHNTSSRGSSGSRGNAPAPAPPSGSSALVPALIVAVLALAGLGYWFYPRASPGSAPAGQLEVFVGADVSQSMDKTLRQNAFDGLRFVLNRAVPPGTPVHFVYYDTEPRTDPKVIPFYEPRDIDSVGTSIVDYSSRPEKGTHQAMALARLAKEADALPPTTPVAFVLLTDSEDQDLPATKEQATLLAKRPDLRALMVIGAKRESSTREPMRDRLQAALEPLGNKRHLCDANVTERDVQLFEQLLTP